jgi:hypothetical protein
VISPDDGGSRTSEALVNIYQTTQRYNPEDSYLSKIIVGSNNVSITPLCLPVTLAAKSLVIPLQLPQYYPTMN